MEEMLNIILTNTFTQAQLIRRVSLLKSFINHKLFGGSPLTELNQEDTDYLNSLPGDFYGKFTMENTNQLFKQLGMEIRKISPLTIYLPIELPAYSIQELAVWLRKKFDRRLLLDIKLDPELLAGCALVWNGMYKDYSIRARLVENKDKILGTFKWK